MGIIASIFGVISRAGAPILRRRALTYRDDAVLMSEPSSILNSVVRMPLPVTGMFVIACAISVLGYYAGLPGFSLMESGFVGSLAFGGVLALSVLGAKWLRARSKVERVKRRFRDLTEEQQRFLRGIRDSGRNWFEGRAEGELWFKELRTQGYIALARPFILAVGEPCTYEMTGHGLKEIERASRLSMRPLTTPPR